MSELPQVPGDPADETTQQSERPELMVELQQLGQQLESTFRAFVAGPGQTIRREVGEALREMGSQVQRTVTALQQRPEAAEIEQKARRAAQQLQEQPVVREVEDTLVSGIQQINARLSKLVERLEAQAQTETPRSANVTQRLVIESDEPEQHDNA